MNPLLSLLAASTLALLDLAVLAWVTARLGTGRLSGARGAGLGLAILLKLGLLALGVAWLARQPWNDRRAMVAGLLTPFALFIVWQVLRLQLRAHKRP